jgi:hypothetical protein
MQGQKIVDQEFQVVMLRSYLIQETFPYNYQGITIH